MKVGVNENRGEGGGGGEINYLINFTLFFKLLVQIFP